MKGLVCCVRVCIPASDILNNPSHVRRTGCERDGVKMKEAERGKIGRVEAGDCTTVRLWAVGWWREALHAHLEQLELLHLKGLFCEASTGTFFFTWCTSPHTHVYSLAVSTSFPLWSLPAGAWNGYPLSISREEPVRRREKEQEREDTRGQQHGRNYLP